LADRRLITHKNVCIPLFYLCQTLLSQLGVYRILDLLIGETIYLLCAFDIHPFICPELREVSAFVEVVANFLRKYCGSQHQRQQCAGRNHPLHPVDSNRSNSIWHYLEPIFSRAQA
jgi:hypothetical protein